ncbi:peptidylprolyl isomerase, partial [Oleiphilus sp. HI0067]
VQRVLIKHLMGDKKQLARLKPGMTVGINTEQGARQATVVKAGKFNVDVDTNHPLAGKDLTFDIEIISIREATKEEISHGHAHGVGGHHH